MSGCFHQNLKKYGWTIHTFDQQLLIASCYFEHCINSSIYHHDFTSVKLLNIKFFSKLKLCAKKIYNFDNSHPVQFTYLLSYIFRKGAVVHSFENARLPLVNFVYVTPNAIKILYCFLICKEG